MLFPLFLLFFCIFPNSQNAHFIHDRKNRSLSVLVLKILLGSSPMPYVKLGEALAFATVPWRPNGDICAPSCWGSCACGFALSGQSVSSHGGHYGVTMGVCPGSCPGRCPGARAQGHPPVPQRLPSLDQPLDSGASTLISRLGPAEPPQGGPQ